MFVLTFQVYIVDNNLFVNLYPLIISLRTVVDLGFFLWWVLFC